MGVECDIQRTHEGEALVFHDWDLLRLTGEDRLVESRIVEQIAALTYLGSEERPATLSQLLDLINGAVPILIEIKSKPGYDVERTASIVIGTLREYAGPHAVMSFDPRVARWLRKRSPHTCVGLVMREDEHGFTQQWWQRKLALWVAKPDFLAYHIAALPNPSVARLRRRGMPVLTWTVNSPETRARALENADALISEGAGLS